MGNGARAATVEPNVGPPDKEKRLEGVEPEQPEELLSSLGQMLARMEEMRRAQAEENRQFLKALQDPPGRRPTPVPCDPSARRPTPVPRDQSALQNPDPRDPSALPTPHPQEPSALPTPDPQDPSVLPTPDPQDPCSP